MERLLILVLVMAPWFLLVVGAGFRVSRGGGRLRRLQLEGALLIWVGVVARWIVFEPLFGIDSMETDWWTYWFARAETGQFAIGLLLFGLGYFLDERPRPGQPAWPLIGKAVGILSILLCAVAGWYLYRTVSLPWLHLPWSIGRCVFMLGFLPFSLGYLIYSRRVPWRKPPLFPGQD